MQWTVVVPAKALPAAKSRLLDASSGAQAHARLAAALRADTVAAALATPEVGRVLLVVDVAYAPPEGVEVLVQTSAGLNPALAEGAAFAARSWPADGIAALLGDLPALTASELSATLGAAAGVERGFVPDAVGTGTTLLTARPGVVLEPRFGADSASRHALLATPLPAGPGLRQDVDTMDDLQIALELGVGPATLAAAAASAAVAPASTSVVHLGGR